MICWINKIKDPSGKFIKLSDFLRTCSDVNFDSFQYLRYGDRSANGEVISDDLFDHPLRTSMFWIPLSDEFLIRNEYDRNVLVDGIFYYYTSAWTYWFHFLFEKKVYKIACSEKQKIASYNGEWVEIGGLTIGKDRVRIVGDGGVHSTALYLGVVAEVSKSILYPRFSLFARNSRAILIEPGFVLACQQTLVGDFRENFPQIDSEKSLPADRRDNTLSPWTRDRC